MLLFTVKTYCSFGNILLSIRFQKFIFHLLRCNSGTSQNISCVSYTSFAPFHFERTRLGQSVSRSFATSTSALRNKRKKKRRILKRSEEHTSELQSHSF